MQNNIEENDLELEVRNELAEMRSHRPKKDVVSTRMRSEGPDLSALKKKTETEEFKMMRNRHTTKR